MPGLKALLLSHRSRKHGPYVTDEESFSYAFYIYLQNAEVMLPVHALRWGARGKDLNPEFDCSSERFWEGLFWINLASLLNAVTPPESSNEGECLGTTGNHYNGPHPRVIVTCAHS
jgi:hypothetical protein